MNVSNRRVSRLEKNTVGLIVLALFGGVGIGYGVNVFVRQQRQVAVANRGAQVMPFDLDTTMHVFERVSDGGLQTVTAKNPNDHEQIRLIREHVRKEAEAFSRGDFSDPARVHGEEMPGLKELRAGAGNIKVEYSDLPNGAQIKYITHDIAVVQALHQWFNPQVTDHGKHAQDGTRH